MDEVPILPRDLGFDPEVVPAWRLHQRQTIGACASQQFTAANLPTGSGKSIVALGIALMAAARGETTTILTHQRALQEQYGEYSLGSEQRLATGRANHPCILRGYEHLDAAKAPCTTGFQCGHAQADGGPPDCPYYRQRYVAENARIRVLNYPYYFRQTAQGMFTGHRLVCDEGHRLDKALLDSATAHISQESLEAFTRWNMPFIAPPDGTLLSDADHLNAWARDMEHHINRLPVENDETQREISKNALEQVRTLRRLIREEIVTVFAGSTFFPVLPEEIATDTLWRGLKHPKALTLMSATLFDPMYWADRLAIPRADMRYIDLPSQFPVDSRPVYVRPVARLNMETLRDETVLRALTDSCDNIIERYGERSGIIHCASFALGRNIFERSRFKDKIVMAQPGDNHLEVFKRTPGAVYLSPSAYEGLDLKDDLCRFNIVAKLSWPNRGDPVVREQLTRIPGFNEHETAAALIQALGRGNRHADDWCHSYVLDGTVWQILGQRTATYSKLPRYIKDAIRK